MNQDEFKKKQDEIFSETMKDVGIKLDLSNEVNATLDNWIKIGKILGQKNRVKEYKQLKKFMKENK